VPFDGPHTISYLSFIAAIRYDTVD